jgi:hypothetical protein
MSLNLATATAREVRTDLKIRLKSMFPGQYALYTATTTTIIVMAVPFWFGVIAGLYATFAGGPAGNMFVIAGIALAVRTAALVTRAVFCSTCNTLLNKKKARSR